MANREFFEIEGLNQLEEALDILDSKTIEQIYSSVNRKAANKAVKRPLATSVSYINSAKDIKTRKGKKDKTAITVGPSTDIYWARFVEKGTEARYTKTTNAYRGAITGQHKIERFYDRQMQEVINFIRENYGEEINRILERKIKRISK